MTNTENLTRHINYLKARMFDLLNDDADTGGAEVVRDELAEDIGEAAFDLFDAMVRELAR